MLGHPTRDSAFKLEIHVLTPEKKATAKDFILALAALFTDVAWTGPFFKHVMKLDTVSLDFVFTV